MFSGINWVYVAEKFVRDAAAFFVASTAFQQFVDGAGTIDIESLGAAFHRGSRHRRLPALRELGLFGNRRPDSVPYCPHREPN
ncbi:MAG: hypothetical protein IPI85_16345 [Dehalococcoidia bacterium]|nr:hypothetical protein [Dehalococcoidia bacterium]